MGFYFLWFIYFYLIGDFFFKKTLHGSFGSTENNPNPTFVTGPKRVDPIMTQMHYESGSSCTNVFCPKLPCPAVMITLGFLVVSKQVNIYRRVGELWLLNMYFRDSIIYLLIFLIFMFPICTRDLYYFM